jgi:hypothetical protein
MTVPGSAVGPARAALYAAIAAQVDSAVHVMYDEPNAGDVMVDDIISVGDVTQLETPYAMIGSGAAGWTVETISLEITVSVFRGGDQAQVVFERAVALVDAVRRAVRADPTLAGTVVTAYPAGFDFRSSWDEKGIGRFTVAAGRISATCQS